MKISIVILNWNGESFLRKFLPTVLKYSNLDDTEVVVADNGSTDGSLNLIKSEFTAVRLIELDKNYGFAGGYNKALSQIEAEYFVLLNSDIEVTEHWLDPLLNYMDLHKDVAACQPKILSQVNRTYFEHAGASGGFIDKYGFPFCRGRIFGDVEQDKGQYNDTIDIFWATGACLMIRSEVFKKVGGLDDDFFAHMEEIDLCWRMKNRAYRIVCIPESTVYHVGGGTLHAEHPYKTYLNFRNNLLMLYKNLPTASLKKTLQIRFWFDYLAALQMFITGKPKNAKSVFKARKDFENTVQNFKEKRNENLLYSTSMNHPEMLQKSIVFSYFLFRKRIFSKVFDNIVK
ncbi:MAG TPA: glycosyltransferase family 2 protein [Paludibacter sp.]|nr:glycosyltransferase family 2 protein [Paludibacter sp.]